jgi:ankyrin repeat protein
LAQAPKLTKADQELLKTTVNWIDGNASLSTLDPLILRGLLDCLKAHPLETTLLNLAIARRNLEAARALLKAGTNPHLPDYRKVTPLMKASTFSLDLVRELLAKGASVNATDTFGRTALHHAARSIAAQADILSTLVSAGAIINAADTSGQTPLHEAVASINPEKVAWLLTHGADPTAKANGEIGTPLHYLQTTVRDLPSTTKEQRERCVALLTHPHSA